MIFPLRQLLVLLFLVVVGVPLLAQENAFVNNTVQWEILTPSVSGSAGKIVQVKVVAHLQGAAHIYSLSKPKAEGPQETVVTVGGKAGIALAGKIKTSKAPVRRFDDGFEATTEFWEKEVTFTIPVRIPKYTTPGETTGWVNFYFMTCDDKKCMPPTDFKLSFTLMVK